MPLKVITTTITTNANTSLTTTTTKVFPFLWESDSNGKSIKRISDCVWEEIRSETSKSIYEFVDFDQQNGLYLYDGKMNLFININDKNYSIGKKFDELITISNGKWQNFNPFGLTSFNLIFKDTERCEYTQRNRIIGNLD